MINKSMKVDDSFLLESLQGGVVYSDFDPPFHLRYCTEGMATLSGYSVAELMDMCQMDLVYEQDIDSLSEEVIKQFAVGDTFSVEYRLKRKDGSLVHVLDKAKAVLHDDNKKYIHCLLTDISDLKNMEQALWLSQEKYKIALKQSGNVIIEFDLKTSNLVFSENYESVFKGKAPIGNMFDIANSSWLELAYTADFLQLFETVIKSKSAESMEFQICQGSGELVWGILHLAPVINTRGEAYAIVGCLKNIEKEKRHISYLTERSEKDSLTGVYNREYMEDKINGYVDKHKNTGGLIITDIDNFKAVNDSMGHAFGDEVLKSFVGVIKNILPRDATLGRLGGDEFLIFVSDINKAAELEDLAKNIIKAMVLASGKKLFSIPITLSIGAAVITDTLNSFSRLYKSADIALYQTKAKGRNGYTIL